MDAYGFVDFVDKSIRGSAIRMLLEGLESPGGVPNPNSGILKLSPWYQALGVDGKEMVRLLVERAASYAALNFLAVLDGADAFETGPDAGELELYYVRDGKRQLLNSPKGPSLHEQLKMP